MMLALLDLKHIKYLDIKVKKRLYLLFICVCLYINLFRHRHFILHSTIYDPSIYLLINDNHISKEKTNKL